MVEAFGAGRKKEVGGRGATEEEGFWAILVQRYPPKMTGIASPKRLKTVSTPYYLIPNFGAATRRVSASILSHSACAAVGSDQGKHLYHGVKYKCSGAHSTARGPLLAVA